MAKPKFVDELPDNDFCRDLKEVHDSLNSKDIKWDNIIWNGKEKEFIVEQPNGTSCSANVLLASAGLPSV